jgi:hypothetical protein
MRGDKCCRERKPVLYPRYTQSGCSLMRNGDGARGNRFDTSENANIHIKSGGKTTWPVPDLKFVQDRFDTFLGIQCTCLDV